MKRFYKIMRALIVTIIMIVITVPCATFVLLSFPGVHERIEKVAEQELSTLLCADVSIGSLSYSPFNRILLRDVAVSLDNDTVLTAQRLGAGVNLYELVVHNRPVINYIEIIGVDAKVYADSAGAPLNIQPILEHLKGDDSGTKSEFELMVNTVIVRNIAFSYDIGPCEEVDTVWDSTALACRPRFNPRHIHVTDLAADILLPRVGSNGIDVRVHRFKACESSGLEIKNLVATCSIDSTAISVRDFALETSHSHIALEPVAIRLVPGESLMHSIEHAPLSIATIGDAVVNLVDIAPFVPALAGVDEPVNVSLGANGCLDSEVGIEIKAHGDELELIANASCQNCLDDVDREVDGHVQVTVLKTDGLLAQRFLNDDLKRVIPAGTARVEIDATAIASRIDAMLQARVASTICEMSAMVDKFDTKTPLISYSLNVDSLNLGAVTAVERLGYISLSSEGAVRLGRRIPDFNALVDIKSIDYNSRCLSGISLNAEMRDGDFASHVESHDPLARLALDATGNIAGNDMALNLAGDVSCIALDELGLYSKIPSSTLATRISGALEGTCVDDLNGFVELSDVKFESLSDPSRNTSFDFLCLKAAGSPSNRKLSLSCDAANVNLAGQIYLSTLAKELHGTLTSTFPVLARQDDAPVSSDKSNNFNFTLDIKDTERWASKLSMPLSVLYPANVKGSFDGAHKELSIHGNLPYLRSGNKVIKETRFDGLVGKTPGTGSFELTTAVPTKHGYMTMDIDNEFVHNGIATTVNWFIDRKALFQGDVALNTQLSRDGRGISALVAIQPGELTFNDSTWTVAPASVYIQDGFIKCDGINVYRQGQHVAIDGYASSLPTDDLTVDVMGLDLGYLFESLSIDNVRLGGMATGKVYANSLLSGEPRLITPGISVSDISYNGCVLGDAIVRSFWDGDDRAVVLDATITPHDNRPPSYIHGGIYPLNDSIDLKFDIHKVPVDFMHHYMATYTDAVTGYASGDLRLWGNFKYIDMVGRVVPDDSVRLAVSFTNTVYSTADSIILNQGEIILDNLVVHDRYGHTAVVDGTVHHKFFKEPTFDIAIKDVDRMLVYNETPARNPRWWGTVYGSGWARIKGVPGIVDITANVTTTRGSSFKLVLEDTQSASEYSFIQFRDTDSLRRSLNPATEEERDIEMIRKLIAQSNGDDIASASDYNVDFTIDVTPATRMEILMDPVGGDCIKATGAGTMRLRYGSADEELGLWGTYTLEKGTYNFTMQDIIIKDFTINPGSSISFSGDPYKATLDIDAVYSLNANLADLDESFNQDRELNRTNVPVNAILKVDGELEHPDISFDLAFPTLNSDTYRKVKSIVNTDEMMNQQIIYLLALNRFYTPDYMGNNNRGGELMSVASATISSQLSNILGRINDNFSIAPSFRSDRGDFKDVEVDVALSSSLLNNRLLLNGNFGYRDKSLNSTQFVGDFDIEYLLNRSGNVRLKAYNRYNDQNFYVRTAQTTQGVGVSYRRNFDRLRDFLSKRPRREAVDTVAVPVDSLHR